ncbi:hypothetical protein ABFX02_06G068300 [Erythranthe guttata]
MPIISGGPPQSHETTAITASLILPLFLLSPLLNFFNCSALCFLMAEVEFEAVLEFLRTNGLSECESALMEDIIDKSRIVSSDFDNSFFPTVPPLRIPATRPPPPPQEFSFHGGESSIGSSDDEFVSLGSSTSELSPSDFINPYGFRVARTASQASSDRLSDQFGTARDYPDFDMQNDLFWYKQKDEDYDFDIDTSEDKFITTTTQTGELSPEKFRLEKSDTKCEEPHETEDEEENGAIFEDKEDDYEIFNLRIIHRKNRTGFEENKELPIVLNTVIAGRYFVTEFLGSAAFSRVVRAHDLYLGIDICLKIIKNNKDFLDQCLDEIKLLKFVNKHDPADEHHILRLHDYFYHKEHLFIVTELLRANLYEFQKYNQESGAEPYFTMHRLQAITRQCLEALLYLHELGIVHCDLKPENILIKSYGKCEIKVIDLGSSCFQTDNLSMYIQSRSYRAPEVMLGLPYDQKIDLWSVGCILAELYSGEVLFPNEGVAMLLARMVGMIGPIDVDMLDNGLDTHKYFTKEYDMYQINEDTNRLEYIIPDESSLEDHLQITDYLFADFLKYLLQIDPKKRPSARVALDHPWLSHTYDI